MRENTSAGLSERSTEGKLTNTGQRGIVVGRIDFKGDGIDIPYNTLCAAKAWRAEEES